MECTRTIYDKSCKKGYELTTFSGELRLESSQFWTVFT